LILGGYLRNKILLISSFLFIVSCSIFNTYKKAKLDNRFLGDGKICYKVIDLEGKRRLPDVCSDHYPGTTAGDRVTVVERRGSFLGYSMEKLSSFESFIKLSKDPNSIAYRTFVYFHKQNKIDHNSYEEIWEKECPKIGLSCRLLAYSFKVRGSKERFFPLMEEGCKTRDIISCFNLVERESGLTDKRKEEVKEFIMPDCLKVKDLDEYHDFCGVLLVKGLR
jgi:hypothetical protein